SGTSVIRRTWIATDDCGNFSSCAQTITVRDTTPPTLACQPDRTVAAGDIWTFDEPTASDRCSAATVAILNTVTNRSATNTLIATRTWLASDACANTNTCQQTITVQLGPLATITSSPNSGIVGYGSDLTLRATVSSSTPCTYQWQMDGVN